MAEGENRYELMLDPMDLWTVWDLATDQPAEFAGQFMMGLTEAEANDAIRVMSELDRRRLSLDVTDSTMPPTMEYREVKVFGQ